MKMNRIQFQAGMNLDQFLADSSTGTQCETALEQARWPDGFQYPKCCARAHSAYRRG